MKKLLLKTAMIACLAVSSYGTEIVLNGEKAKENINPFKEVLNVPKKGDISINIKNDKLVLPVETNLRSTIYHNQRHNDTYTISKESLNNVVSIFAGEDYRINNTGDTLTFEVLSGKIEILYMEDEDKVDNMITKVEATLIYVDFKGRTIKQTIVMDHKLGVTGDNYDWTISTKKDYLVKSLNKQIQDLLSALKKSN